MLIVIKANLVNLGINSDKCSLLLHEKHQHSVEFCWALDAWHTSMD